MEEIMGFGPPVVRWVLVVVRMRFWAPGSPPRDVGLGAVRCPVGLVARFGFRLAGRAGAWWFENWIVDASKKHASACFLLLISFGLQIFFCLVFVPIVL
ncbi:hypothetical protein BSD967_08035 [Bifidobacterium saguini]|uniref:Transmembrane protein n=1 Tax=Bifidobacterium saguini TaxID=762210 RepID=A0ABX7SCH2_9BIFI|nr:hypothetical protein [Bifidobacterium saguini]QTB90130.1 hypothetical protein BSD967_07135 [Bifidobacterium saguini]QTB90281.1 hypothetical protein BSD967_08035 [Bifidobacterium saguini]